MLGYLSLFRKLGLDLHIALHMALKRRPPVLHRILALAAPSRQLYQIRIEPLLLHLVQLLPPLRRASPTLHTVQNLPRLHYPRLADLLCSPIPIFKAWKSVCERLEVCDELLVGTSPFKRLGGGLFDSGDERGVFYLLLVAL
jgi:hypothetical protein